MLCSPRVILEFCSSPLGHRLWFSTVNKHDVVLTVIARTGMFLSFLSSFSTYLHGFTCLQIALREKRNTALFTSHPRRLSCSSTVDTDRFYEAEGLFPRIVAVVKLFLIRTRRQTRFSIVLSYSILHQILSSNSVPWCHISWFKQRIKLVTSNENKENVREVKIMLIIFIMTKCTSTVTQTSIHPSGLYSASSFGLKWGLDLIQPVLEAGIFLSHG